MFCPSFAVTCFLLAFSTKTFGERADKNSTIKTAALGDHPYMGYVYFPDESIQNMSFYRAAVLVDRLHLITASIITDGHDVNKTSFPRNTLIAIVGAVLLKTENGDSTEEEETDQEREVIQLIRPKNYTPAKTWMADISVVKVIEEFKVSSYVNVISLNVVPRFHADETCSILLYMKIDETKQEWRLQKRDLKMMGISRCQKIIKPFNKDYLLCANELNNKNISVANEGSCEMHAGGPLLCENELVGIQTYSENVQCRSPFTFQRISSWNDFIKCGLQGKCDDECENLCKSFEKDEKESTSTEPVPAKPGQKAVTKIKATAINTAKTVAPIDKKIEVKASKEGKPAPDSGATAEDGSTLSNDEDSESDKENPVNAPSHEIGKENNAPIPESADAPNLIDAGTFPEKAHNVPLGVVRKSSAEGNVNVYVSLIVFCLYLLF